MYEGKGYGMNPTERRDTIFRLAMALKPLYPWLVSSRVPGRGGVTKDPAKVARDNKVCEEAARGVCATEIAQRHGISRVRVYQILRGGKRCS